MESVHYFNYKPKQIPEGEAEYFFQHPIWDLKCNQLGVIYFGDSLDVSYNPRTEKYTFNYNRKSNGKTRPRLVYECYSNSMTKKRHMSYLNGIPLDLSVENIMFPEHLIPEARHRQKEFMLRSYQYMLNIEEKLLKKGIDPCDYWEMFVLTEWMKTFYTSVSGKNLESALKYRIQREGKPRPGKAEVLILYKTAVEKRAQGMTYKQIAEELGVSMRTVRSYEKKGKEIDI
jgi:hypothetical protein